MTTRTNRASRCIAAALVALLAACPLLPMGGCASDHPLTLLESDVPAPPEMDVRYSFDIVRDGGELSGGRFVLAGRVDDVVKVADETSSRYTSSGWTVRERTVMPAQAVLVFEKGSRTARVEIEKRRIDPQMSSAIVVLRRTS